jgi:hypothetical protein
MTKLPGESSGLVGGLARPIELTVRRIGGRKRVENARVVSARPIANGKR